MKRIFLILFLPASAFVSCKSGPSEAEIKNCLLRQYECGEYAKINDVNVINSRTIKGFMGQDVHEVIVNGEIEWTSDCRSFFAVIPAGRREKFKNKSVMMMKMDRGWDCP